MFGYYQISPLFEVALVLVRLDHVASLIINANHGIISYGRGAGGGLAVAVAVAVGTGMAVGVVVGVGVVVVVGV
jgi:hypothetical protein